MTTPLVKGGPRKGLLRLRAVPQPPTRCECLVCGAVFFRDTWAIRRGYGKYCGRAHAGRARRTSREAACLQCGKPMLVEPNRAEGNRGRYCGRECSAVARAGGHLTLREAFEARLSRAPDRCWTLAGDRDNHGYVQFRWRTTLYRGHRVAYRLYHGDIPPGMVVRHSCHNRWCVNPEHLSIGTKGDNARDAMRADRHSRGERNGRAVTDAATVRALRQRYDAGGITAYRLAKDTGLTRSLVYAVVTRRTWKHLP